MITPELLRSLPLKKWSARAWINNQVVTLAEGLPQRTLGSELRNRSTCIATLRGLPPAAGGEPALVDLVLEGVGSVRFFTGKTEQRSAQSALMSRQANLIDVLNLDRAIGTAITWDGTSYVDAVEALLDLAGIAATDIDSIFDPGADYELGQNYPITIEAAESLGQVWRNLMDFGGTTAYVAPSGRVRVVDAPGIPMDTSETVYARGHGEGEFGIEDAGYTIEGNEGIVSVFTATGPKRPDGQIPDGTFTATGIVGRSESQSYRFLQSDATAQIIARREVGRRARARVNVWVEAPLNPFVTPGDTILFRDAAIGISTSVPAIVLESATTADAGMRLQLSIGASLLDGYANSIGPPVVDFSMLVETQLVTLDAAPEQAYLVQCQSLAYDPAGAEITTLAWTATGPDASPTSSSDPAPLFVFSLLAGASIELTATAATGESATQSRPVVGPEQQTLSRVVSVAAGSGGWRVLVPGVGWRSWSGPGGGATCTAVPSINENGPLISGWSNGAIYVSADALATTPTLLDTLDGSIGALWVNEADPDDMLAGHGSALSRSQDAGATWEEIGDGDFEAVTDCQNSPANPNEIRVTAGDSLWLSYDGGASWVAVIEWSATYAGSATAEALATAPWGRAAVFSGTGISAASALLFEEAYTVDWSGATAPTDGLTSITPLLDQEGYIVGDNADLIRDGALSALVLTAGSGDLWRLLWDGAQFVAEDLLPTTNSYAGKLINGAAHYAIDTEGALSIGYGSLGGPELPPTVYPSLIAQSVALNLGVFGTPPAGWEQPAFDASAWGAAVASGTDLNLDDTAETIRAAGTSTQAENVIHVTRQTVTVPPGRVTRARIRMRADNLASIYVGGQFIGIADPDVSNPFVTFTLDVPPTAIATGSLVIAARITNLPFSGASAMGVEYLLELNYL